MDFYFALRADTSIYLRYVNRFCVKRMQSRWRWTDVWNFNINWTIIRHMKFLGITFKKYAQSVWHQNSIKTFQFEKPSDIPNREIIICYVKKQQIFFEIYTYVNYIHTWEQYTFESAAPALSHRQVRVVTHRQTFCSMAYWTSVRLQVPLFPLLVNSSFF